MTTRRVALAVIAGRDRAAVRARVGGNVTAAAQRGLFTQYDRTVHWNQLRESPDRRNIYEHSFGVCV